VASVGTSVDALLVLLLGGVHQLWGAVAGSLVLAGLTAELGRGFVYWKAALGMLMVGLILLAPQGLLAARRSNA
jgi:branched-chain amino acid transport system permease protein